MFETYVDVKNTREDFFIPELEGNFDGLNFLANQNMSIVNPQGNERAPFWPIPTAAFLWASSKWIAWAPMMWAT